MGTYYTSEPSGYSEWSDWATSNIKKPTAYQFRTRSRIGRGPTTSICVHVIMEAQCYDYGASPATVGLRAQVSVGNTSSYVQSEKYTKSVNYGTTVWTTVKELWYVDTATKGTKVYAKTYCTGSYITGANEHTAPDYTTEYTISYRKNADDATGSTSSQTKTYGHSLTLRQSGYSRSGYAFAKWNTASDGSGTSYKAGASYTKNAAATLYAQWAPNTYAVTYDANGGEGTTEAQSKVYGEPLTLQNNAFTREGYVFLNWNTSADGSGTAYQEGASYTEDTAATLYAIWAPDSYTVSYDGNGAESGTTAAQTKTYGAPLILQQNGFVHKGYGFTGWNTAQDGSGTGYAAGATYTANEAVTLYAQWVKTSIPAYVNVGGTVYQADRAYANVKINNVETIVECEIYANVDGSIVQII